MKKQITMRIAKFGERIVQNISKWEVGAIGFKFLNDLLLKIESKKV